MSITFFDPSTGDRVMLPSKNEVCSRCFGSGTHDSWDNGMTVDEMYEWGEDFVDDYFAGHYDTVCEECNGNNVVAVIDEERCTPEQIEAWNEYQQSVYEDRMTANNERKLCYGY
jgi:hypothetical protein